jgi:protein-ribulosamine 3-kinase
VSGHFLEAELRRRLADPGLRVSAVDPVGGGCIHHAARLSTSRGDFFAKWNEHCPPDAFLREADGLRALQGAGSELVVPEVVAASAPEEGRPAFIIMEYLPPANRRGTTDEAVLARGVATLHRQQADTFGFPVTTYCGPTPQDNRPSTSWVEFYGERRLGALLRLLDERGRLGAAERRMVERLIERLPTLLPHEPAPSLIHGDLWSGNVVACDRGQALVDPACAYADPEMEFGITTLFGGFSKRFFEAYLEAAVLPPGFWERNPLYQLYHLLNHFLIFGGHYGTQALALARRYA